jgi:hypothetical protein
LLSEERNHLDDLRVERIFKRENCSMDWADVAHKRDKRRALVHRVENLQFLSNAGISLLKKEAVTWS